LFGGLKDTKNNPAESIAEPKIMRGKKQDQLPMPRLMLTDAQWTKLSQLMLHSGRVYRKREHRKTLEAILYKMRAGIPWRDLPSYYGQWSSVFKRFNFWSKKDVLDLVFKCSSVNADPEWLFIDGSIVRAHQHSAGAASDENEAIGKSRGGNWTKIHLAVDTGGLPVYFELSGGQVHDIKHAKSLVSHSPQARYVIADKGYDSDAFREDIEQSGAISMIPRRENSKKNNDDMDWCLYGYRHLVEKSLDKIKIIE
jgi:transposase